jgi:hypothetical protein
LIALVFWQKFSTVLDSPVVTFKNKVYAEVMLKEIATGTILSQSFQTSTVKSINDAAD